MRAVAAPRRLLLDGLRAALDATGGRESVRRRLAGERGFAPRFAFAVGKAAPAMMAGAFDGLGAGVERALVVTKHGHAGQVLDPGWPVEVVESSHPVPDESCLTAGRALVDFVDAIPAGAEVLALVSGGASALVELLPEGFDASDLARVNAYLLAAGHPIGAINRVRKRISRIKGGRLARRLATAGRTLNLAISDVPGDDPKVIGSGLLVAHSEGDITIDDLDLPPWLVDMGRRAPPLSDADMTRHVRTELVARPADARSAAAAVYRAAGVEVVEHPDLLEGDAVAVGRRVGHAIAGGDAVYRTADVEVVEPPDLLEGDAVAVGRRVGHVIAEGDAVAHVWGSETTVVLPPAPGRGGRCQSLALAAALEIRERPGTCVLAAGTDGTDGPGDDAGAIVDAGTVARGVAAGLDPERCLGAADAGAFLEASGDLVHTGPTGTNVMDLVVALKAAPR